MSNTKKNWVWFILIMALIVATPMSAIVFHDILGVTGEVLTMVREALWILCVVPLVVALRNYFHSLSMVNRRTWPMALGSVLRVAAIWSASWLLYRTGLLTHVTATAVLVLGFVAETVVVSAPALFARRAEPPVSLENDLTS